MAKSPKITDMAGGEHSTEIKLESHGLEEVELALELERGTGR
jgi:hypothetical protein